MRGARSLLLTWLVAGCASSPGATHGHLSTGFLSSYTRLTADPVRPDVFVWRLEGADLSGYDRVIVDEPVMRRRLDDCLPSPADRDAMRLSLQAAIEGALKPHLQVQHALEGPDAERGRTLRIKSAITTALVDHGAEPPVPGHEGWGEMDSRFAFECELLDAANARPLARMVAFDRTQWIPARQTTDWSACERDFAAWAADAVWLVQRPVAGAPPAGAGAEPDAAPEGEPAAAPAPGTSDSDRTPVST